MGNSSSTHDAEKGGRRVAAFNQRGTLPIFAYLTIQNFVLAAAVGVVAIVLYNDQAQSSNSKTALLGLATARSTALSTQTLLAEQLSTSMLNFTDFPLRGLEDSAQMYRANFTNLTSFENLARWFLPQIAQFPMSTTFSWAEYPSGDNLGIAVQGDQLALEVVNTIKYRACPQAIYNSSSHGCRVDKGVKERFYIDVNGTITTPYFEAPTSKNPFALSGGKPWGNYALVAPTDKATWYNTVKVSSAERGTLGLYYAIYTNGIMKGTFEGEMELSETQSFLTSALDTLPANAIIYIIQRQDSILVGSTVDSIVYVPANTTKGYIVNVNTTTSSFVMATQDYLEAKFVNLTNIVSAQEAALTDPVTGINYLVTITPVQDGRNLDWLVILGAPETDYIATTLALQQDLTAALTANNRKVIGIVVAIMVAILVAATAYVYFAVVRPLHALCLGMQQAQNFDFSCIAEGTFVARPSFLREVYEAQKAFYDMTTKFATAFKNNRQMLERKFSQAAGVSSGGRSPASTVPLIDQTKSVPEKTL
ncbi:hypothetical protein HKX48_005664 [Thoreauomyces humboldtii]|nr:hypothetical protein HKX48_005664 [Thoreauomyces humboldtii]